MVSTVTLADKLTICALCRDILLLVSSEKILFIIVRHSYGSATFQKSDYPSYLVRSKIVQRTNSLMNNVDGSKESLILNNLSRNVVTDVVFVKRVVNRSIPGVAAIMSISRNESCATI